MCSHVGTILVTVEQCVQDGLQSGPSVTSKPSVWSRVTKKWSILAIIILINNNNCYYYYHILVFSHIIVKLVGFDIQHYIYHVYFP